GVRAGIMGFLYLMAQKLGRQSLGVRVVAMAAAVMLAQNPLLLAFDVGFQLSFLAVLGLIFLEPAFSAILSVFTKNKFKEFVKIMSATFAAQVFTLPILLYNFGNISLVSPITNLLVGPVVYWLMIFGFLSSFVGILSNCLGWILATPCYLLLKYFLFVINFFSRPWAITTFENVHWVWLIILYCGIIAFTRYLSKKTSHLF
ncbi:MAG TPA: ComEC/Rec2 family competence protein, partial [Candidatus Staskawiczbacteria bacterium]|nr:ComEC/Rec2 family competence protein [Candidatus Staskawiczbacteria bacterium]